MQKKLVGIVVCMVVALSFFSSTTAADPDAQLEIKIVGGLPLPLFFHYVGGAVANIGDTSAYNITIIMTIRGGILGTTNETVVGYYDELPPQQAYGVGINNAYGFGLVTITLTASASNTENVTGIAHGVQMGGFTWIPFSWIHLIT